jgi:hypothetical protein
MTFLEIRDRAHRVRGIPLQDVLRLSGAEQDRYDKAKWHTPQGILSVTGPKFMNWTRGIGGGGAIDLVIHLHSMDFKTAVQWLWHHFPGAGSQEEPHRPPLSAGLKLPPEDAAKRARVRQYLVQDRGLPPAPVQSLIHSGRLYADPRGNAVFVLLGNENKPVGAELRGTSPRPWKAMATGSQKDLGYFSTLAPHPSTVILCESAIDAISCAAIHPQSLCLSTSGARPNPRWLAPLIRQGLPVYCGFDADATGDDLARAMIALHPTVKRLRPALHDWNDLLKAQS